MPSELELSQEAASKLRMKFGSQFEVTPSWNAPGRFTVTPKGVVGAVCIPPGHQLLIEPKVELDVAVYMLEAVLRAGGRAPELRDEEALMADASLTAVLATWFSGLALPLVERSLLHRYRLQTDRLVTVRGRINVASTTRQGFRAPPTLVCEFDEFTPDTTENQMIRAAAVILGGIPGLSPTTARALRRIDSLLGDVSLRVPMRWEREAVRLDRLSRSYAPALAVAEWVLQRSSPEVGPRDRVRMFETFLIVMHEVFEAFIGEALGQRLTARGFRVRAQDESKLDQAGAFSIKPDIVAWRDGAPPVILDTKYKAFDEAYRPVEADIYQLLSYCVALRARRGFLVYPEKTAGQHPRSYFITGAGVEVNLFPIVLGSGRQGLSRSVDELARAVGGWEHRGIEPA
jgi:5-methylcytosine-specific restriction enzyme subunit McrC